MAQAAPPLHEQTVPAAQASPALHAVPLHEQIPIAQVPDPPALHDGLLVQPHRFCTPGIFSEQVKPPPCMPQLLPQPPQLALLLLALSSHPLSAVGTIGVMQLAKPRSHVESHTP